MTVLRSTFILSSLLVGDCVAAPDALRLLNSQPLHFEPAPAPQTFIARGAGYQLEFAGGSALLRNHSHRMRLDFAGSSRRAMIEPAGKLPGTSTVIHGNDPSKWRSAVPTYQRLQIADLYLGIDLTYYGTAGELEYDLTLQAGANPDRIRLKFSGETPSLDAQGTLSGAFVQKLPIAYQLAENGNRLPVSSRYRRNSDGTFSFALGPYNQKRPLIIDPVLSFSAYVAGSGQESARAIGHDSKGLIYVAGNTTSSDLTLVGDSFKTTLTGTTNIFIAVLDPTAAANKQLVYSTYFGGTGADTVGAMTVSSSGTVHIVGTTTSTDFPLNNAAQSTLGGGNDAFVLKFIPAQGTGGFYYASYLGGTGDEAGNGITVDSRGKIYLAGSTKSTDFPLAGAIESSLAGFQDAFVSILDPAQSGTSTLAYSTYLGGTGPDIARDLAVASDGTIWVVGNTYSSDYPIGGNPFTSVYAPGGDAFISQINPSFSGWAGLVYSTFFGGLSQDQANKILIDSKGRLVVAGNTSSVDFPVTANAMQPNYGGGGDAFISILDPTIGNAANQLVYSTFYGGKLAEVVNDIKQDPNGFFYVTGFTLSPDLPVASTALQVAYDLNLDAYALKFDPNVPGSSAILYSSYAGSKGAQSGYGVDYDANGAIYLAGSTTSGIFDSLKGVSKPSAPGQTSAFIMGVDTCSIDSNPHSYSFGAAGGSTTVAVLTTRGCSWAASSPLDWVTIAPASGSGQGSVTITIAPNTTGSARQGNINLGTFSFLVGQNQ